PKKREFPSGLRLRYLSRIMTPVGQVRVNILSISANAAAGCIGWLHAPPAGHIRRPFAAAAQGPSWAFARPTGPRVSPSVGREMSAPAGQTDMATGAARGPSTSWEGRLEPVWGGQAARLLGFRPPPGAGVIWAAMWCSLQ